MATRASERSGGIWEVDPVAAAELEKLTLQLAIEHQKAVERLLLQYAKDARMAGLEEGERKLALEVLRNRLGMPDKQVNVTSTPADATLISDGRLASDEIETSE